MKIPRLALVYVAPQAYHQSQNPDRHQDVVAREPAEIQHRGRKRQHRRSEYRAKRPKPFAKQQRQQNQRAARYGVQQPRSVIAIAEQQKYRRVQLKLQRPVHQRVVRIPVAGRQLPGVVGVQALVVMHRAAAQIPQPHRAAHDQQRPIRRPLPRRRFRPNSNQRRNQPPRQIIPAAAHIRRPSANIVNSSHISAYP